MASTDPNHASPTSLRIVQVHEAVDLNAVRALLERIETHTGLPAIDEAEQRRLDAAGRTGVAPQHTDGMPAHWAVWLAARDEAVVGMGSVHVAGGRAQGELAVEPHDAAPGGVLLALLDAMRTVAHHLDVHTGQAWLRQADEQALAVLETAGASVARRLAVLGRALPVAANERPTDPIARATPTVRAYRPDVDDVEVVAVLAAAYAGTDDGGWDLSTFCERRSYDWFRAEDLLVAEVDGRIGGLHWTKRRSASVGEVYNLAVHPDAQGRRLGPVLLEAGLAHLHAVGCDEVVLWVDRANARAVRLYESHGFTTRGDDVALTWD